MGIFFGATKFQIFLGMPDDPDIPDFFFDFLFYFFLFFFGGGGVNSRCLIQAYV